MPQFHGSLTNEDFVLAMQRAKEEEMELKDWVSAVVIHALHADDNVQKARDCIHHDVDCTYTDKLMWDCEICPDFEMKIPGQEYNPDKMILK